MNEEQRERLAALEHEQWAHWMRNLFGHCEPISVRFGDGYALVIPAEDVARWSEQMDAPYSDLTEHERTGHREWADKVLELMGASSPDGAYDKREAQKQVAEARTVARHLRDTLLGRRLGTSAIVDGLLLRPFHDENNQLPEWLTAPGEPERSLEEDYQRYVELNGIAAAAEE